MYFRVRAQQQDEHKRCSRAKRDDELRVLIQRVYDDSFGGVYGPRKVWRQLRREGHLVARSTVERVMREMGLAGAVRGRAREVDLPPVDRHAQNERPPLEEDR